MKNGHLNFTYFPVDSFSKMNTGSNTRKQSGKTCVQQIVQLVQTLLHRP